MWKLTFFVNCSGWLFNSETGKRGYENVHYFETDKAAREWVDEQNKKFPHFPVDIVSLKQVTFREFTQDIILPL